eukprot:1325960-Rhodomonas_salina.3
MPHRERTMFWVKREQYKHGHMWRSTYHVRTVAVVVPVPPNTVSWGLDRTATFHNFGGLAWISRTRDPTTSGCHSRCSLCPDLRPRGDRSLRGLPNLRSTPMGPQPGPSKRASCRAAWRK